LVVPSFESSKNGMDATKMPLMAEAIATQAQQESDLATSLGRAQEPGLPVTTVSRLHRLEPGATADEVELVLTAIYRQIMDCTDAQIPQNWRLLALESEVHQGRMSVRQFIRALVASNAYYQRFCSSYPAPKVVDILYRQLLGRGVVSEQEREQGLSLLRSQGSMALADALIQGSEYQRYFGENGVPYRRGT
ncbi:photosystem I reaction center subunit X, partial [filamentous cyanobacterium CCP5]